MRPGTVILVTGLMGAGKGLVLQWLGFRYRRWYLPVANYDSCWRRLENVHQLLSLRHSIILLDEFDFMAHSRAFSSKFNISFSLWLKIQRKCANCVVLATQNPFFLDISIRRVARTLIYCERAGPNATLVNFLDTLDGERYIYRSRAVLRHSSALYLSYDTADQRVLLSFEVDGRASVPDFSVLIPDGARERYRDMENNVVKKRR